MINQLEINANDLNDSFVEKIKQEYGARAHLKITVTARENSDSDSEFWKVISKLDWSQGEDDKAILKPATNYLANQSDEQIIYFAETLAKKLYELDKKKYAKELGKNSYKKEKGFSSDNFLYARACVVANGLNFFEKVKQNPTDMPKSFTFEPLLRLADMAWYKKHKTDFVHDTEYCYETFSNPKGWKNTWQQKILG